MRVFGSFVYNPANGNLLVDLIIPVCVPGITNGDVTDQFPNVASSVVAVPFDLSAARTLSGDGLLLTTAEDIISNGSFKHPKKQPRNSLPAGADCCPLFEY